MSAIIARLWASSFSSGPGATVVMSRLADILLVQALRAHISAGQCQAHGLCALADPQIGKSLSLIHEKPAAPWTVETETFTADCAAVQPNRETERCVVNNPPAGDYYIMVYGYHEYWGAKLTVTATK